MKRTQFALYIRTDEYGRRSKTTWKMSPEGAAKLTDPEIIPSSIEWRDLPEPSDTVFQPGLNYPDCRNGGRD